MRYSYRWLSKYLSIEIAARDLADLMTRNGLEVERVVDLGYGGEPIVIAEIQEAAPHPTSDSLRLCKVSTGAGPPRQVVTAAQNVHAGDRVPLALPGARLSSGLEVAETVIRGQRSEGMLCSGAELGWSQDASGLLILPKEYEIGEPLDFLIDATAPPNRPDCLSAFGLARDIAAQFGKKVYPPTTRFTESLDHTETYATAAVRAREHCVRYGARCVTSIRVASSPLWLRRVLESAGVASVNNVVDVANFVMMDLGQPIFIYDLDKLSGNQVIVRLAEEGETLELLDGRQVALNGEDLVVADASRPLALAGIMQAAAVQARESTVNVLIESACFSATTVRRTAQRLNLATEASYRFERGMDRGRWHHPLSLAAYWVKQLAGGEVAKGAIDIFSPASPQKPISLNLAHMNQRLGLRLNGREVADILVALGFEIVHFDHDIMTINVPTFRVDIQRDVDLMEEVARLNGYDKIPSTQPHLPARMAEVDPETRLGEAARTHMTALGFQEIVTQTLVSRGCLETIGAPPEQCVALLNPLSEDQAALRPVMAPTMLDAMRRNVEHGSRNLRLFEVGRVYRAREDTGERVERLTLCAGLCGAHTLHWRSERREADFYDLKGVAEHALAALNAPDRRFLPEGPPFLHPGRSARIRTAAGEIGWLGELHPSVCEKFGLDARVYLMELDLASLQSDAPARPAPDESPRFPAIERDLALLADHSIASADLESAIREAAGDLLEFCVVFDVFRGNPIPKDKKSLTYRLVFRARDRSLTEAEVDTLVQSILQSLEETEMAAGRE